MNTCEAPLRSHASDRQPDEYPASSRDDPLILQGDPTSPVDDRPSLRDDPASLRDDHPSPSQRRLEAGAAFEAVDSALSGTAVRPSGSQSRRPAEPRCQARC